MRPAVPDTADSSLNFPRLSPGCRRWHGRASLSARGDHLRRYFARVLAKVATEGDELVTAALALRAATEQLLTAVLDLRAATEATMRMDLPGNTTAARNRPGC